MVWTFTVGSGAVAAGADCVVTVDGVVGGIWSAMFLFSEARGRVERCAKSYSASRGGVINWSAELFGVANGASEKIG
jgi:hypothetical protein